jgi:hypothetical protein
MMSSAGALLSERRFEMSRVRPSYAIPVLCRSKGMKSIYRFKVLKVGKRDLYRDKVVYLVRC